MLEVLSRDCFVEKLMDYFLGKSTRLLHANKISMGKNCFIGDFGYINALSKDGVNLGNNVTIREYCWLQLTSSLGNPGIRIDIGDNTYIGPRVNLGAAAPVIIGERCQIGASVSFIAENHEYEAGKEIFDQGVIRKGIIVGNNCWIGNQAVILDGVTIGNGAVIGAGSVVTKNVPPEAVMVGNPARVLKMRNNNE